MRHHRRPAGLDSVPHSNSELDEESDSDSPAKLEVARAVNKLQHQS
jgi:hypothetical protein